MGISIDSEKSFACLISHKGICSNTHGHYGLNNGLAVSYTSLPSDSACVEVNNFGFEDNILMTWK